MTGQPGVMGQPAEALAAVPNSKRPNVAFEMTVPPELVALVADAVADRLRVDHGADETAHTSTARPRLTLSFAEAATAMGMSVDHFRRHVLPDLRVVRSGRLRLVPLAELDAWIDRTAARALEALA
jgi:hypothetical protein